MKIIITLFFVASLSLFSQSKLIWENQGAPVYNSNAILSQTEKVMAVTNSSSKPTTIWDVESGKLIDTIGGPMRISYDISLTGEHFVYLDNDNVLHFRNVYTHTDDKTYNLPTDIQINALKVLNNGQTPMIALLLYKDGKLSIEILDLENQQIVQQYPLERDLYENYGNRLYVNTFGDYIAFSFMNGVSNNEKDTITNRIVLIDTKNETLITKSVAVNRINSILLAPEKNKIILATGDWSNDFENVIELDFDLNKTAEFEGLKRNFYKIDFESNNSENLIALSDDTLYTLSPELNVIDSRPFNSHQTMEFMNGNRYLQMKEYQVRIRNIETDEISKVFEHYQGNMHRMDVTDIEVSKDDKYVFSSSWDGTIKKWDAVNGQFIENFILSYDAIRKIAISENNEYFAYTGFNKIHNITLLDFMTKEEIAVFDIPSTIIDFEISEDSKLLVVGTYGGQVYIYDLEQKNLIDSLDGGYWVNAVGFSSDNKYIASGNQDGVFKLWDFDNKELLFSSKITDKNGLYSVEFSDYRDEILISSGDGSLKIFDLNDLKIQKQYYSNENSSSWSIFKDAIYSKDGSSIFGGMHGAIKTFKLGDSKGKIIKPDNPNFSSFTVDGLKYLNNEIAFVSGDSRGNVSKWGGDAFTSVETKIDEVNFTYPNPVNNILHIKSSETTINNRFEIISLLGEVVKSGEVESEIDVTGLGAGTYIITLFDKNGITRNKFIKQ